MHHSNQNLQFTEALCYPNLSTAPQYGTPTNLHSPSNWRTPNLLHAKSLPKNGILAISLYLTNFNSNHSKTAGLSKNLKYATKSLTTNPVFLPLSSHPTHPLLPVTRTTKFSLYHMWAPRPTNTPFF